MKTDSWTAFLVLAVICLGSASGWAVFAMNVLGDSILEQNKVRIDEYLTNNSIIVKGKDTLSSDQLLEDIRQKYPEETYYDTYDYITALQKEYLNQVAVLVIPSFILIVGFLVVMWHLPKILKTIGVELRE